MPVPNGFEVPIHKSLTEGVKFAGVPREIALINGTLAMAFGLGAQSLLAIPVGICIHAILAILTRKDSQILPVLLRNLKRSARQRL